MAPQLTEQTKGLLEPEPITLAQPSPRRKLAPRLWLYFGLIAVWTGILWNAVMVACEHERLRLTQLPVSGDHIQKGRPPIDRFYIEDPDSTYWMIYTKRMISEGKWRIRYTDTDNAPFGREVHWSSPPAWWLIGIYRMVSMIHPGTLITNLSWASYFSNPILECLLLLGVAIICYRRFGAGPAFIAIFALSGYRGLIGSFAPAAVGHHGWQVLAAAGALLSMLCGSFGFVSSSASKSLCCTNEQGTRRWLAVSGFFSGFGFALGAPAAFLTLVAMVAGALLMLTLIRLFPGRGTVVADPAAWTRWGGTAALTSLILYGLEYFPHHLSMVLETNHPIYSVGFFCSGLILRNLAGGGWKSRRSSFIAWILGLAGILTPPILIKFGPLSWFVLKEPSMIGMHRVISEFQPYLSRKFLLSWPPTIVYWGITLLAAAMALQLMFRRRTDRYETALLLATLLGSVLLAAATLLQVRWINIASAAGFACLLATFLVAHRQQLPLTQAFLYFGTVLLSMVMIGAQIADNSKALGSTLPSQDARMPLVIREMAGVLAELGPTKRPIVLADIGAAPYYILSGGVRTLGSFYWENDFGLQDWFTFFGTNSFEVAETIARYRHFDWIVQLAGDNLATIANDINGRSGLNFDAELGSRLVRQPLRLPSWIKPFDTVRVQTGPRSGVTFLLYKVSLEGRGN